MFSIPLQRDRLLQVTSALELAAEKQRLRSPGFLQSQSPRVLKADAMQSIENDECDRPGPTAQPLSPAQSALIRLPTPR